MTSLGEFTILLALVVAVFGFLAPILGARRGHQALLSSARNSQKVLAGLLTISVIVLVYAFLTDDFSIEYVASYSSRTTPFFYKITAFWAGQKGSLLLWVWLLSVFGYLTVWQNRHKNQQIMPYVQVVINGTCVFFLTLMVLVTPVFEKLVFPAADGQGLNPLLQNPGMVFHPTTLYLGFVGFTIPFSFALAALITGKLDDDWLISIRRWTIFSWFFLLVGNLLGAQWAYVELGWGGFWAWDPVENASFMPWLTGTAFLHSVMIQEKRGMLKVWNMALIILTFFLTIFGTFITRSGIVSSVHSFGVTTLGPYFFGFMGLTLFVSIYFLFIRLPLLKSKQELDGILSRESSFLLNNLLLVGIAFAVFWGTIFPFISEAVRGVKITVGPPFFNQVIAPLGLGLILVTGICPLISWRRATAKNLLINFSYPFAGAIAASVLFLALGMRNGYGIISFSLSVFVVTTILLEFLRGASARHRLTGESYLTSLFNLTRRNKRRYGGYIIHFGVILMVLGITGVMNFKVEKEASLRQGQTLTFNQYTVRYGGLTSWKEPHRDVVAATLNIYNGGKRVATLKPEKAFHKGQDQPTTEVAILSTFKEDFYAILAGWDDQGTAQFKFLINPLVIWLWIGGGVITLGAIMVMWPDRRRRIKEARK
ncbi:MAG: heme lyase CcmF/NrfE family subunit [Thermodesulfobacteriota bacterium]